MNVVLVFIITLEIYSRSLQRPTELLREQYLQLDPAAPCSSVTSLFPMKPARRTPAVKGQVAEFTSWFSVEKSFMYSCESTSQKCFLFPRLFATVVACTCTLAYGTKLWSLITGVPGQIPQNIQTERPQDEARVPLNNCATCSLYFLTTFQAEPMKKQDIFCLIQSFIKVSHFRYVSWYGHIVLTAIALNSDGYISFWGADRCHVSELFQSPT